jgi:hypothetical protein
MMRVQRFNDRAGVARIDYGGVHAVMHQPQVIVFESRNGEHAQGAGRLVWHSKSFEKGQAWIA